MLIRDAGLEKIGYRIRRKHPGSATLVTPIRFFDPVLHFRQRSATIMPIKFSFLF
jgi:hypothetical protein